MPYNLKTIQYYRLTLHLTEISKSWECLLGSPILLFIASAEHFAPLFPGLSRIILTFLNNYKDYLSSICGVDGLDLLREDVT